MTACLGMCVGVRRIDDGMRLCRAVVRTCWCVAPLLPVRLPGGVHFSGVQLAVIPHDPEEDGDDVLRAEAVCVELLRR